MAGSGLGSRTNSPDVACFIDHSKKRPQGKPAAAPCQVPQHKTQDCYYLSIGLSSPQDLIPQGWDVVFLLVSQSHGMKMILSTLQ